MKCAEAGENEAMQDKIDISPTDFLSPQKLDDNDYLPHCFLYHIWIIFGSYLVHIWIILESQNNCHNSQTFDDTPRKSCIYS